MRMDEVEARKAYIQRVRQSFDTPGRKYEFEKEAAPDREENNEILFVKIRLVVAALLFAAYVFCDQTGIKVYRYTAGEVAQQIAKNYDYLEAKDEVMAVFQALR